MTIEEAKLNIGQQFKVTTLIGMRFDTIRSVSDDGTITGDFMEAYCEDCRLKQPQPEHLKKTANGNSLEMRPYP